MKRLIGFSILLFGVSGIGFSASQPHSLGYVAVSSMTASGGVALWQRSKAEINVLTPDTTGQLIYCNDCVSAPGSTIGIVCVSTGVLSPFSWTRSTGTPCR